MARTTTLPDEPRVERCARAPELGPRILFFTGGSALRDLSRRLKHYTHNSIHLVTPFDSGGSSAELRRAFAMPSVGDLRNRLMALADESVHGNDEIHRLFAYRFPDDADPTELGTRLRAIIDDDDPLIVEVPSPTRHIIRTHLGHFAEHMPVSFDLRGASIGNLVIAGGYLSSARDLESVIFLFSQLIEVRGTVRPVVDVDLHLSCELADGTRIVGQHLMTGKGAPVITSPIRDLHLVARGDEERPVRPQIHKRVAWLIETADLICYPPGSFYSSVIANLLPAGVGRSIAGLHGPKVYIPNGDDDPEQLGMNTADSVEELIEYVRRDAGADTPAASIVNVVLVDAGRYARMTDDELRRLGAVGVEIVHTDLATPGRESRLEPDKLSRALVSMV